MAAPTGGLDVDVDVAKGFENYLNEVDPDGASPQVKAAKARAENAQAEEEEQEPPVGEPPTDETVDADEEAQPSEDEQEAAPEDEEPAEYINTLSDLAESFEIDEGQFLDHFQVEGQDGESVSLATVINSYREGPTLDAAMQAELESTRTTLNDAHDARMNDLSQLTAQLVARVQSQQEPEGGWARLRETNAGEYIRLQEEQAAERADAHRAIETMERERQSRDAEGKEQYDRYVEAEKAKLFRIRPDWKDQAKGRDAYEDINTYLDTYRFSDEQKTALVDANSINTVWKAAQYDKLQASKKGLRKRLRKLPAKHVVASARDESAGTRAQQKKRESGLEKFKKTGRLEDGLKFFREHIDG